MSDENWNDEIWAKNVEEIAGRFEFPPTPDVAGDVRRRITARSARGSRDLPSLIGPLLRPLGAALLIIVIMLALIPDWRARAFDWLGIGAVRILPEEAATHTPVPHGLGPDFAVTPVFSVLDLQGAITLEEARARVDFPVPVIPALGAPDAVYVFEYEPAAPVVILAWAQGDDSPISLHIIGQGNRAFKYSAEEVVDTAVGDHPALFLSSPYLFEIVPWDGDVLQRFVNGSVLIWEVDDITYRLEGELALDEAITLAESLE